MLYRSVLLIVVTFGLPGMLDGAIEDPGSMLSTPPALVDSRVASAMVIPMAVVADVCATCDWSCDEGVHKDIIDWGDSTPIDATEAAHDTCVPLLCSSHSPCTSCGADPSCPNSFAGGVGAMNILLEELRLALMDPTPWALEDLLTSHAEQIKFNRARHAIQVLDCEGQVSLHVALGADVRVSIGD